MEQSSAVDPYDADTEEGGAGAEARQGGLKHAHRQADGGGGGFDCTSGCHLRLMQCLRSQVVWVRLE